VRNDDDDDDDVDDDEATSCASNETPAPWPKVDPESLPKTMMKCKEKTMVRMPPRPRKRKVQRSCRSNLSPPSPKSEIEGKSAVTREKTSRSATVEVEG
jgi:hypothetical protein